MKRALVLAVAALAACKGGNGTLDHPFLWAVEKDGTTTYMLGTMHMGIDAKRRLPEIVWQKLEGARAFAMETDPNDVAKLDLFRGDGTTLHSELGAVKWRALEDAVGSDQAIRVDRMKPFVAATIVGTLGLPQTLAMDGVLLREAQVEAKPLVFLEPIESQAKILEKWMTTRALGEMLDDVDAVKRRSHALLDAYTSGDEAAVQAVTAEEHADALEHGHTEAEYADEMKDLVYSRNAAWIPELERFHADGGGFVAVGTLHLVGPGSVLDLLRQRGYKVTRLTP
jgi:uncharacterized protein